ncbi:MAG TPA: ATP-binding protein [Anaerolineaceae bacterium]|nr:ATP-binding protein [Anaerolineaceae bacterium]HPN53721.1 ATP-binding protein [Anaerolineaceae bacterium]
MDSWGFTATMRRSGRWIILIYLTLYTGWLLVNTAVPAERLRVTFWAALFPAAAISLLAIWISRSTAHLGWGFLGAGLLSWFLSDLGTWLAFPPALTDFFHLAGLLLILISLFMVSQRRQSRQARLRLLMDMTISSAAMLTLFWQAFGQPALAGSPLQGSPLFALFDLLLMLVIMNLFLVAEPGSLKRDFIWIWVGLTIFTLRDLAAGIWFQPDSHPAYLMQSLGYACLAFGLIQQGVPAAPVSRFRLAFEKRLQSSLPLLATFLLGGYSLLNWYLAGATDPLGLWVTVVLALALIARQGIVAGEMEFQQYAVLVNSIAEPAFICDAQGRLRMANPALLASIDILHADDLIGQPVLRLFTPESLPPDLLKISLRQGWSGDIQMRRADGSTLPVTLTLRPISRSGGERLALAGTAHDLTEQRKQQAALQQAYDQVAQAHRELAELNEQLEEKVAEKTSSLSEAYARLEAQHQTLQKLDELKSDFISLVSHELRAPLTNISGGIELVLLRSQEFSPASRQSLTLVQGEIRRLNQFVETILDLSALDAGRMPLYLAPLALSEVVRTLRAQLHTARGAERVGWDIPANLPAVLADPRAMTSIFFHLIDNALKYAPEGAITIQARAADGTMEIKVMDQGPGLAPEALPMLFEKFYRSQGDSQLVYGHGLGLYIVRRFIEAMNGDISAENRPEGGACFTFHLKAIEEKDE